MRSTYTYVCERCGARRTGRYGVTLCADCRSTDPLWPVWTARKEVAA